MLWKRGWGGVGYVYVSALASVALMTSPAMAALSVNVTATPEPNVEKTYTITIDNKGNGTERDIGLPDLFNSLVTLASEPTAEYFVYTVESYDGGSYINVFSLTLVSGD